MCDRNSMRVIKKWQNEQIFFKALNQTSAVAGVCFRRIRAEELGRPCGSLCEAKKEVMRENVAASPALSRARDLQAIQRVNPMVEGQNKRRRLKKREIVCFSSIIAGEAHTDCSGIAVIFKVTHTNPCSGGATWNLPSGGEALLLQSFFLHLYHSLISTLSKPHIQMNFIFFIYSNKRMPNEALFRAGLDIS